MLFEQTNNSFNAVTEAEVTISIMKIFLVRELRRKYFRNSTLPNVSLIIMAWQE